MRLMSPHPSNVRDNARCWASWAASFSPPAPEPLPSGLATSVRFPSGDGVTMFTPPPPPMLLGSPPLAPIPAAVATAITAASAAAAAPGGGVGNSVSPVEAKARTGE